MNPLLAPSEIRAFLDGFPRQSQRRGEHYFRDHAVVLVACVETDRVYSAIVRGGEDYNVELEYDDETRSWFGKCSCPVADDCKHIYAAMLALQANASRLPVPLPAAKPGKGRAKAAAPKPSAVVLRAEPQPPASPLSTALAQALGRKLDRAESDYVRSVQRLSGQARNGFHVTIETLRQLSLSQLQGVSWEPLTLWPEKPRDDHQFWLYCAWELRKREASVPSFMSPVTDFTSIEPAMRAWERRNSIEHWRMKLANSPVELVAQAESQPVDFRVMVLPEEVRVQWRNTPAAKFKDLKPTHLRRFSQEHENGSLTVCPETMPLWLALYQICEGYYYSCSFGYDEETTAGFLGQVLRVPTLAERILTADETPLARPAEPLRYSLRPAADETDDYEIALTLPDGASAPPVLLPLPGRPTLYLTERALFHGPAPHRFGLHERLRIPAPALETAPGIEFLQHLNLDLPQRITERTRRIEVGVKLSCELKPTYLGSDTDALFIRVTAQADGLKQEQFAPWGWHQPDHLTPQKASPTSGSNGMITLLDRSAQRHFPSRLEALAAKWDDYHTRWRVRLTKTFPEQFVPWLESMPPEIQVQLDPELATLRDGDISGEVQLNLEEAGVDWFDLRVVLNVSDLSLTQEELKLLLNARGRYVRLGKKGWRRLHFNLTAEEDERLARLGLNPRDFTAEPQRLHALQLADEAARKFLPEDTVQRIERRATEIQTRVTPSIPGSIAADLRPYQVSGFHFLAYLTANRFGGVLADDMGLGKTLQTLTWIEWLRVGQASRLPTSPETSNVETHHSDNPSIQSPTPSSSIHHPPSTTLATPHPDCSLVICPKSVMDNWRAEAERFCSRLRVWLWLGEDAAALETARAESDIIVLNYAQLRSLSPQISNYHWLAVILDEAQYIKNPDSQTAQVARALKAGHRLALTGTPIENRLLDLWSIFAFAMPGVLGNRAQFSRHYNQQDDPFARRRLAARVRPFLLRRTKGQVARELPDRIEEDLLCEIEGDQQSLYRAELKRAQQFLLSIKTQKELNEQRFHFLTSLLRLRQICCHPALVSQELRRAESAKLSALLDLLEPLMEEGHKVLVFSQFVSMLEILRETVAERQWRHFYLAGDTENRGDLVNQFQTTEGAAIFLISLKAGGFGLNLTAASYVILFDPWWNPAVEIQAIDRTHRIGQTSKVIAYRLLVKDSIEQKIRHLQRAKAALAQDILGEERFAQSLTLDDLRFLLG